VSVQTLFFFTDTVKSMYSGRWDGDIRIWNDLAMAFQSGLIMIDLTTDERGQYFQSDVEFHRVHSVEQGLSLFPNHTPVFVEDPKALRRMDVDFARLQDFQHPQDVVYVFGPDAPMAHIVPFRGEAITLPCKTVWAASAAAIVLYDREIKR
jgi:hypothetical protein